MDFGKFEFGKFEFSKFKIGKFKNLKYWSVERKMTRTMGGYKVSEDGGAFKLPCFDRTSEDWMLEVKMLSTMYPQGDKGNVRCQYDTRFLPSDKLGNTVCIYC